MQAIISCSCFPRFSCQTRNGDWFFGILHACSMACGTASCRDLLIQELWSILSLTLGVFPGKYCLPTHPKIGQAISRNLCSPLSYVSFFGSQGVFEFETFLW
jgi:hypothetical protein